MAGEESDGLAKLPGGDQIGTAAGDGGAGAVTDDGGRQGDGEAVGDKADLGSEAGIGFQGLCDVGEEGGQGEQRIALRRGMRADGTAYAPAQRQRAEPRRHSE